jgi:hypothetical protein
MIERRSRIKTTTTRTVGGRIETEKLMQRSMNAITPENRKPQK